MSSLNQECPPLIPTRVAVVPSSLVSICYPRHLIFRGVCRFLPCLGLSARKAPKSQSSLATSEATYLRRRDGVARKATTNPKSGTLDLLVYFAGDFSLVRLPHS